MTQRRNQTKASKRADSFFGYAIPGLLMIVACYQVYKTGTIDKYVLAALFVFGLGALGWRIDVFIEQYFESKRQGPDEGPPDETPEAKPKDEKNDSQ